MSWWKRVARLIFLGALVATILFGPLLPGLGTAIFGSPRHVRCGSETFMEFSAPSSHDGESETRPSSQDCSFDYSITLNQATATLIVGTNVSVIIFASLSRGIAGPVGLSVRGLPDGLAVSLTPSGGLPPFSSVLSIAAGPTSPIGSFSIIVTGSNPTAGIRTASLSLTVNQPPTGPAPSSSLTSLGLGTEAVILVSLGEALLGLYIIGRRISGKPRKPVMKTKR